MTLTSIASVWLVGRLALVEVVGVPVSPSTSTSGSRLGRGSIWDTHVVPSTLQPWGSVVDWDTLRAHSSTISAWSSTSHWGTEGVETARLRDGLLHIALKTEQ